MLEPFALLLYREFLKGRSIADLSGEYGITADRIERRLRAAALLQQKVSAVVAKGDGRVVIRVVRRF